MVNSSQGGGTKDTWVLESLTTMLSRTADSLFWLARYVERAENIARIVLVGHRMASDGALARQPPAMNGSPR